MLEGTYLYKVRAWSQQLNSDRGGTLSYSAAGRLDRTPDSLAAAMLQGSLPGLTLAGPGNYPGATCRRCFLLDTGLSTCPQRTSSAYRRLRRELLPCPGPSHQWIEQSCQRACHSSLQVSGQGQQAHPQQWALPEHWHNHTVVCCWKEKQKKTLMHVCQQCYRTCCLLTCHTLRCHGRWNSNNKIALQSVLTNLKFSPSTFVLYLIHVCLKTLHLAFTAFNV